MNAVRRSVQLIGWALFVVALVLSPAGVRKAAAVEYPSVVSIDLVNPSPTAASQVEFAVEFSMAVQGVDATDFKVVKTNVTGAAIVNVATSDNITWTVTVGTGTGDGKIRLDLRDDDTISDLATGLLTLAGTGVFGDPSGDGSLWGDQYTVDKKPTAKSPGGTIWDRTPLFRWTLTPAATQYQYQLKRGTTVVWTKTRDALLCGLTFCEWTPTTNISPNLYSWRVRSMVEGKWLPWSGLKNFKIVAPAAGYWSATPSVMGHPLVEFYVTPNRSGVKYFRLWQDLGGCGLWWFRYTGTAPIAGGKFSWAAPGGVYYFRGTFSNLTPNSITATGTVGLKNLYLNYCGYAVTRGPYAWSATWVNTAQPDLLPSVGSDSLTLDLPGAFEFGRAEP